MQTYDILMIVVLAAATIFGFWKGLAWQVASLASLVASYFVALKFADQLAPRISQHAPWNKFLAMLILYAATSFVIWMLFRLVAGAIDRVQLREFDRQMGALIGFGKGVLFCIAITFFAVTLLGEDQKQRIVASKSGQAIVKGLDKADAIVPPEIHEVIGPYIAKVEERLNPDYHSPYAGQLEDAQQLWQNQQKAAEAWSGAANTDNWPPQSSSQTLPQTAPQSRPQTPAWPVSTSGR